MNLIDCKGLKCPQPVINTKKYFDSIKEGQAQVIVDNEVAMNNVCKFADSNGFTKSVEKKEENYYITIQKTDGCCNPIDSAAPKKFTLVVSSDKLGAGDDKLGAMLMKSYMYALSESDVLPDDILFLNSGVKLTTEGSGCIESLKAIINRGVNIFSCGTCLDFYEIKDKLLVGEITNMYTIVEKMNNADKTIKL